MSRMLIFLVLSFISCKGENLKKQKNEIVVNETITKPISNNFEEISNKSKVQSNEILSIADFTETEFALSLIFFEESEKTFLNINENYFNVNWYYTIQDESINSNNILLFKNNSEHIILIPTFSEEFPTFQMVGISKNKEFIDYGVHTYSLADFEKLGNTTFDKIKYQIVEQKDGLRIKAVGGQKEILLSDYSKNENSREQITQSEKNEIIRLRNDNSNSFVISCGSGCAMTYTAKNISQKIHAIKVDFNVDMYVDETLSDTYDETYIFKYDSLNKIIEILPEGKNENILKNLLPDAQKSFIEFGNGLLYNKEKSLP